MDDKKILIVEDDGMLRQLMVARLKEQKYIVSEAEDGALALKAIFDQKPDLILLDLMLPKVDGFTILEKIRSSEDRAISKIHVIVLSNLYSNKDILRAKDLKIDEYFVKAHTDMQQVSEKVRAVLAA